MEIEVPVPPPAMEFNFDSACSSPYMTAPSSPRRFGATVNGGGVGGGVGFYFSAPTSPTRISSVFYSDISAVPFQWEDKPGVPKSPSNHGDDDVAVVDDFEFDFSGQLDRASFSELSAADELFDGGKIRPLKPPPGFSAGDGSSASATAGYSSPSPRSPRSPRSRIISQVLTMRRREFEVDPFAAAIEETRRKEITTAAASAASRFRSRNRTRSLSPMRVSDVVFNSEEKNDNNNNNSETKPLNSSSFSILSAISSKKWRLRDLLLFRSASEGRSPRNDDVLKRPSKYEAVSSKRGAKIAAASGDDVRNSSFRSTDSVGSVSSRRRGPPASAHEIHYTANRAVSEELRRKTFLPYKQGLLGCLGFGPAVHNLSRRFGSLSRE